MTPTVQDACDVFDINSKCFSANTYMMNNSNSVRLSKPTTLSSYLFPALSGAWMERLSQGALIVYLPFTRSYFGSLVSSIALSFLYLRCCHRALRIAQMFNCVSSLVFQNKVMSIDAVKVKLQVRTTVYLQL